MSLTRPLLTAAERATLTGPERRELRQRRRAERRDDRERVPWIRWSAVESMAADLILDAVADAMPGSDKLDDVVRSIVATLDSALTFGALPQPWATLLEVADGPVASWVLGGLIRSTVQRVHDRLKAEGRLQ
jgi:hypothetical protein